MRRLILNISTIFILTGLFSCEEEYKNFKAENYKPAIVIEGLITDENPPYYVKVSRSVAFGDSINDSFILNAKVRLSDNEGNSELLSIQKSGIYRADSIHGKPGNIYSLEVKIGDSVFNSNCVMPLLFSADSLIPVFHEDNGIYNKGYYVKIYGKKPQTDSINFFKCQIYQNSRLINNRSVSYVFSDEHTSSTLNFEFQEPFALHDTAELEIQSITHEVFIFFSDINMLVSDDSFVFEYQKNPRSNISNGALGCFQASSVKRMKVIIQ